MNAALQHAQSDCFHCAEPLPASPIRRAAQGQARAFCCTGCAAAAAWIEQAHLDDYYRLRNASGNRVGAHVIDYRAWDRSEVTDGHVHAVQGGREIVVLTDGMHCAACAWLIDRALRREPGVLDAGANAVTGRVRITWDPQRALLSDLLARMAALGYRPSLATGQAREASRVRERNRWLLRLGIAGLGAMQAMMFAEALYLDSDHQMPLATRDFFRWLTVMVSTPVVFYAGWPFIHGMLRELRERRLGMDTLVAMSTLMAWAASLIETLRGGPHVWFDAAVMFVFLLLLARMLEQRARQVASAQVDALARATPALAMRETADGSEYVAQSLLALNDVVRVAPGEAVPADGQSLQDQALLDEALLTGESTPVRKSLGESVYAGSLCRETPLRMRVTRIGSETRLSQLAHLVEQAQTKPLRLAVLADRIAAMFVPLLLLSAFATWMWWRVQAPERAFEVALAVLVVSCPCALSLAIPAALAVAQGTLSRMGILALRGDAIDSLAQADRIMLDKTGTLSTGETRIDTVRLFADVDEGWVRQIAAALERDSTHPLAGAFALCEATVLPLANDVRHLPGWGIEARIDGRLWRLGRRDFAAAQHAEASDHGVWLGDGRHAVAHFAIAETQRLDARQAIGALGDLGLHVELCSGDAEPAVRAFADALGIPVANARQGPEDKLRRVRALQAEGHTVAMVGDGINDAPVLAGADVSIALSDGAALAQRAADFVAVSPWLMRIPESIALARRTRAVVRQNLFWALAYNIVALPMAASGHVTPWIAALGMAVSSLLVTLNALRLGRTPSL